ncbi:unnamed protein product [Paramecium octaurelia]|uniref:Protein kinase domain-containing protein n=1 Tax=Paramecium octaurelia TaxID=43137 RepID=A0A8S1YE08_PAROT|nr:unnamed protein product [Paramecium octaurelia]
MDQDQQQRIEQLQQNYFFRLKQRIHHMVDHKTNQKIATLLYTIIFDDSYYEIARVYNYCEQELNNLVAEKILIALSEIELNNTQQLIQVIPWFILFVIGQNLDINNCINLFNQSEWGMFLAVVAQKCKYDPSAQENFVTFQMSLKNKFKEIQFTTLEETVNLIVSTHKLLELLNQMFYYDYYPFAISQPKTQDKYFDLKLQKRQQIITNSYYFLEQRDGGKIPPSLENSKMKVAISFIEKNYNYGYLTDRFHNEKACIVIFSLIRLDHMQFQNFFYSKRPSVQELLLNQIMDLSDIQDNLFLRLLLVGKCLSNLRLWEQALKFYIKLQNIANNHQGREKEYSIYISFKICKIQFLKGEIDGLQEKLKNLNIQIQQRQNNFYYPKNRSIYHQCLFLQLLMSVYTNSTKLRKYIKSQIDPIILQRDSITQKRIFNVLQYSFWKLADKQEIIFKENQGKKQLVFILNQTESICQERQGIIRQRSNFLSNITSFFNSPKGRNQQFTKIKSYYRAVQEILIINALVRHEDICVLQYFNPNLYPLLRVLLAQNGFFDLKLKPFLYIFMHDFEEAFNLALQTKNHEIIGQILEYQGKFEEAIGVYQQLSSLNNNFNCAILLKFQEDQMIENPGVKLGNLKKKGLHAQSINYFKELAQQNQGQYYNIAQKYLQTLQPTPSELTKQTDPLSQQFDRLSRQSSNLMESGQFPDFTKEDEYFKSKLKLDFPIRQDIKLFYSVLKRKLSLEQDSQLIQLLDEFVKKTLFLKYEIQELINNDLELQQIGQGGNGREKEYSIYISFKICKIQFLKGEIDGLQEKLKNLNIQIQQRQNNFYYPKNRSIYHQCLFLQLLMSVYTNSTKLRKYIKSQIDPIILQRDSITQKRIFNVLQYSFWKLADKQEIIFKENQGKKQLVFILNQTESICQERQGIIRQRSNFLSNITSFFNSPKGRNQQFTKIKSYYRAVQEILIINALVRHEDICVLQYFNPNLYPLLRVLLAQNGFFDLKLKPFLYIFMHDFEEAFNLALQTKNHEIIGQILEYQGKFEEAIGVYQQLSSLNNNFNCAILLKFQEDQMIENPGVKLGNLKKKGLHAQSINYFKELAQQNQGQYYNIAQKYLQTLQPTPSELTKQTDPLSQQFDRLSRQSSNLMESGQFPDFTKEDEYFKSKLKLDFPIRQDIKLFYSVLKRKLSLEQDSQLIQLLDEFVKKTLFLKYEIQELINNDLELQQIGQGGNGQIYKLNFQGQPHAAKVISFNYKDIGDTMLDDEKSRLENILQEICILCDNTVSKNKYCLQIEQLGFEFEELYWQSKLIKIVLVTKIYNNNQVVKDWDEKDKIKFIYKLSLGFAALQFERRLLHLDLKPENVLVDSKNNPVIIDFGMSKYSFESQHLGDRSNQMTISYRDPELINSNYQSRKNDVYSFGVSLFYYFTGCIPYSGFHHYQIIGNNEQFYPQHRNSIQNIKNQIIQELIINCTLPIAQRISFVLVLKRLFLYQYQQLIKNPKVTKLIEWLFDQIEYNKDNEQMKAIYTFVKVMKQFIKYTNTFQPQILEKTRQCYEIISNKASSQSFIEIIQRMKQFINWAILNDQDYVLKLVDFELNWVQSNQNELHVSFNFWVENAQQIQSTDRILWNPFYLNIAQILQQIHAHSICLQQMPLEFIYLKDGKVKLNCFEYSLNSKLEYPQLDSDFQQSDMFISKKDVDVLCELIGQTRKFMKFKLDQDKQDRVTQFLQFLNQSEVISLEEIIGKLQN